MRDNFAAIRLLLAFADGGEKFNLSADVLQLRVSRKPVQQFNDELFIAHEFNVAKDCLIARRGITTTSPVRLEPTLG